MTFFSLILLLTLRRRENEIVQEVVAEDNNVTVCVRSLLNSSVLNTCKFNCFSNNPVFGFFPNFLIFILLFLGFS